MSSSPPPSPSSDAAPAWELAKLFPLQGQWRDADYARGGVQEYWIIDPFDRIVTVLTLDGDAYEEVGVFRT